MFALFHSEIRSGKFFFFIKKEKAAAIGQKQVAV